MTVAVTLMRSTREWKGLFWEAGRSRAVRATPASAVRNNHNQPRMFGRSKDSADSPITEEREIPGQIARRLPRTGVARPISQDFPGRQARGGRAIQCGVTEKLRPSCSVPWPTLIGTAASRSVVPGKYVGGRVDSILDGGNRLTPSQ